MSPVSAVATGVVAGLIGIVALYLAAHALDTPTYAVGLVVFGFAVAFEFWLIKRWFDYSDRGADRAPEG
jgi:ABC-type maltose transport system permease subunit